MDWYILMMLTYNTDIGKMSELTLGQGHKFKGQGQICACLKNGKIFKINGLTHVDDTYIYH